MYMLTAHLTQSHCYLIMDNCHIIQYMTYLFWMSELRCSVVFDVLHCLSWSAVEERRLSIYHIGLGEDNNMLLAEH